MVASRLPRCVLWAALSSRLTFSLRRSTLVGPPSIMVYTWLCRLLVPVYLYAFILYLFFPYISPIYPSPLVYWLCHTFVVYQQDSCLIQAKASPLPLSLVPSLWALSPPLGIPLHWLDHGLQPHGLQPSDPRLPLAASSSLFHLLWSSRFFIHLSIPWAQIPHFITISSHAQTQTMGRFCS